MVPSSVEQGVTFKIEMHSISRAAAIALLGFATAVVPRVASATGDPGLVPISWALDVTNGKASNVAVAVPWTLDYSGQSMKNSVKIFRIFPHISLLGKADAQSASLSNNPHFAMGGGFCLINALAVGVGFNINQPFGHAYVMAGLSLTDIVKIAFW
jgi:hypothetical protein